MSEQLEIQAAKEADQVLVITEAIIELLAERGVERSKMTFLPDAVDVDEFAPRARDELLAARLGLSRKTVIGLIGTFKWYEGIELLLDAAASMRRELGDSFRVLLVGDGPEHKRLAARSRQLDLEDIVVMTGRVPHDRVADYYSLIDIGAYPRTNARVCQLVSPLKPLEAMAMAKAVVVSDVRALAEMVQHERTGRIHSAGDADDLARRLTELIASSHLRQELGENARAWVSPHRSWRKLAGVVEATYRDLLGTSRAPWTSHQAPGTFALVVDGRATAMSQWAHVLGASPPYPR